MDVNMPVMDGLEAIRIIKKEFSNYNAQIICCTAYSDKEDQIKCIKAGANSILVKPITQQAFY